MWRDKTSKGAVRLRTVRNQQSFPRGSGRKPIIRVVHPGDPAIVTPRDTFSRAVLRPVALRPTSFDGFALYSIEEYAESADKRSSGRGSHCGDFSLCLNP